MISLKMLSKKGIPTRLYLLLNGLVTQQKLPLTPSTLAPSSPTLETPFLELIPIMRPNTSNSTLALSILSMERDSTSKCNRFICHPPQALLNYLMTAEQLQLLLLMFLKLELVSFSPTPVQLLTLLRLRFKLSTHSSRVFNGTMIFLLGPRLLTQSLIL